MRPAKPFNGSTHGLLFFNQTSIFDRPNSHNYLMAQRILPARYATVARQVWVPCGGPSVSVGLGFRF